MDRTTKKPGPPCGDCQKPLSLVREELRDSVYQCMADGCPRYGHGVTVRNGVVITVRKGGS